jgi:hypothetical protein
MARKYKISETARGYAVLILSNKSGGYCYEDTGRRFQTQDAAEAYIEAEKEATAHGKEK